LRAPRRPRTAAQATGAWLAERWLALALGLAASVPIVAAMVERVTSGWQPLADNAVIAVRSLDVLTTRSPLVGQWSLGPSQVLGEDVYSLGPLLYWLLALPARLPGAVWLELTMGLVNVACVLGVVGLAHRRGGRPLMFAVAVAIPVMLASLPAESLSDIWNASVPLLPFTLLLFLAWSLACGEYRLLPLTALVASFAAQAHLSYAPPTLGAVGLAGLALSRRAVKARWVGAAIAVAAVCWSAPLLDQAIHRPGNLVLLARAAAADDPGLGLEVGWHAVVRAIGILPWWLRDPQVPIERLADLTVAPDAFATGSAVVFLGALVAAAFAGRRRGRGDVLAAVALALVLCVALASVTASTPQASSAAAGYTLLWAAPVGMWVWLVLGWSFATLLSAPQRLPAVPRRPAGLLAGLGLVAAVGGVVALSAELRREPYAAMRTIADRLERTELPRGRTTRVEASSAKDASFMALGFQAGVVYAMRRRAISVSAPSMSEVLGPKYGADSGDSQRIIHVAVDNRAPGGQVIARLAVKESPAPGDPFAPRVPPTRSVTVTYVDPSFSVGRSPHGRRRATTAPQG
jgi:hypothetical protein